MTKPKRTTTATLLCLCLLPLLAVSVFADKALDSLKKELKAAMTEAQNAVKGRRDLEGELEELRKAVADFNREPVETGKLPELKDDAVGLIERANTLRDKANNPRSREQINNQMTPEDIERRRREIHKEASDAYTSAEEAARPLADEDVRLAGMVKKLKGRWDDFETAHSKTNTADKLAALEQDKDKLIEEANALKTEVGNSGPGILDDLLSLFSIGNLLRVALALVGIVALGYAGWFAFRLNRRVGDLERLHAKVVQRLKNMEGAVVEQRSQTQAVSSGVTQLREEVSREVEELRRSYRDVRAGASRPVAAAVADSFARLDRAPARDPSPTFPALVSDYLSKVSDSKKVEVEADFRTNLFVPAPGGPFVLVQDDDGTGSGIVLPKSRLQKGQEFVSYYKGTYYCDSPSAGEVFVVEPAVVDQSGGGWRLRSPGRLELK